MCKSDEIDGHKIKMNEQEFLYRLWLHSIPGIGTKTIKRLREVFSSEEKIFHASKKALAKVVSEGKAGAIFSNRNLDDTRRLLDKLTQKKIRVLFPDSEEYPKKLLTIYDSPQILYAKGILKKDLDLYNRSIGIVGARKPDVYGREMAFYFGRELAKRNISVISGLALGVDGMAHRGALAAGGHTVAVLGCGIDVIYPRENMELYMEIEERGTIISEYGLDVPPNAGQFPGRNRLISGLSDGVLVVEARKKSGSLITADFALEQGRQVYAVPGRVDDVNCEGTNQLIKMGAMCVTCPEDILMDFSGIDSALAQEEETDREKSGNKNLLAPTEKMVYSCLSLEPMFIDDIIVRTKLGVTEAISTLYIMEEKGMIKQPVKGYYIKSI